MSESVFIEFRRIGPCLASPDIKGGAVRQHVLKGLSTGARRALVCGDSPGRKRWARSRQCPDVCHHHHRRRRHHHRRRRRRRRHHHHHLSLNREGR